MTQKMEEQLRELAENFHGDFVDAITNKAFDLITTAIVESKTLTTSDKVRLVRQFCKEVISVDEVINEIL